MKQQFNAMEFMTAWEQCAKDQVAIMLLALSKEVIRERPLRASGELADEMLSATTIKIWEAMARPDITTVEDPINYFRTLIIRAAKEVKYDSLVMKPRKVRKLLSQGKPVPRRRKIEKHEPYYEQTLQLDDRDEIDEIMSKTKPGIESVVLSRLMKGVRPSVIANKLNVSNSCISKIKRRFFDRITK